MRGKLKGEAGLSFIEVFFAMVMVLLAVGFFMESLSNTGNEFENLSDRLVANQIVQERISNLKTVSGLFPALQDLTSGKTGVYVTCSDRHGVSAHDSNGKVLEFVSFTIKPGEPSGKCDGSEVESQFAPSGSDASELKLFVLLYARKSKALVSTHQHTIRLERNI